MALSRFMSQIIIGNIRHLLGGQGGRGRGVSGKGKRDDAGWGRPGEKGERERVREKQQRQTEIKRGRQTEGDRMILVRTDV